ncbi:LytR C-terminal domain-containing protein [Streptomyces roseirectus]|uniref:LytR C-terminal domain-containing protein n=1 Tax=Streptomyces roseirectus TaxID=2768066 RepID=A0A7H0ISX2_9ACTN|nr:LytR C-terminal domain-containing protein [Streptomyces roseirectus]QNP75888.1 LytR C-terminal domain-containing protein [Streptomyces roseirectus]
MGGKYRITGDKYPRMRPSRRRGRLVVVVVACGAVLGVAGWGTLQLVDVFTGGGGTASAASSGGCAPKSKQAVPSTAAVVLPKPAQITVNVFNATTRSGLAKSTADELKKRGFKVGQVGNAPAQFDKKVPGAGVLVGLPTASGTSLSVVGVQLPGAERKMDAARKDASVDFVIGNAFKGLATPADAAKALTALSAPKAANPVAKKGC